MPGRQLTDLIWKRILLCRGDRDQKKINWASGELQPGIRRFPLGLLQNFPEFRGCAIRILNFNHHNYDQIPVSILIFDNGSGANVALGAHGQGDHSPIPERAAHRALAGHPRPCCLGRVRDILIALVYGGLLLIATEAVMDWLFDPMNGILCQ